MKKALLLTIVFTLWATMAFAQVGVLSIFADVAGNDCNLADVAGLNSWHVVHMIVPCATAIRFKAELPACYTASGASFLSDTKPWPVTVGDSQVGVAVAYGQQESAPIHVLTVGSFGNAGTAACCAYPITPAPGSDSGTIEMTDCSFVDQPNVGSQNGMINSDVTCNCLVAVHETTWGQIKSLYRLAE